MAVLGTPSVSLRGGRAQQWRPSEQGAPARGHLRLRFPEAGPGRRQWGAELLSTHPPRALGKRGPAGPPTEPGHTPKRGAWSPEGAGAALGGEAPGRGGTHRSSLIFLRATSCPVSLFLALYTTP